MAPAYQKANTNQSPVLLFKRAVPLNLPFGKTEANPFISANPTGIQLEPVSRKFSVTHEIGPASTLEPPP
jgi:hypothetical protein